MALFFFPQRPPRHSARRGQMPAVRPRPAGPGEGHHDVHAADAVHVRHVGPAGQPAGQANEDELMRWNWGVYELYTCNVCDVKASTIGKKRRLRCQPKKDAISVEGMCHVTAHSRSSRSRILMIPIIDELIGRPSCREIKESEQSITFCLICAGKKTASTSDNVLSSQLP